MVRQSPLLRMPGRSKNIVPLLALLFCVAGCQRHEVRPAPYARFGPPPKPEDLTPKVTVVPNQHGPVSYQWNYTNGPDGARMLQFQPSHNTGSRE